MAGARCTSRPTPSHLACPPRPPCVSAVRPLHAARVCGRCPTGDGPKGYPRTVLRGPDPNRNVRPRPATDPLFARCQHPGTAHLVSGASPPPPLPQGHPGGRSRRAAVFERRPPSRQPAPLPPRLLRMTAAWGRVWAGRRAGDRVAVRLPGRSQRGAAAGHYWCSSSTWSKNSDPSIHRADEQPLAHKTHVERITSQAKLTEQRTEWINQRKLHIASATMSYVLCPMSYALCPMSYAPPLNPPPPPYKSQHVFSF